MLRSLRTKNKSGFMVIEVGLIVLVLGLVTFVGWFVWHSKNSSDKLLNNAVSESSSEPHLKKKSASATATAVAPGSSPPSTSPTQSSSGSTPKSTAGSSAAATSIPPVIHPTSQDIQQADIQANAIQGLLEAYYATNDTYPEDLSAGPLINQPGVSGASASTFNAPAGTAFNYFCTKGGPGVCAGYNLQVRNSTNNTVIETLYNQFNS